MNPFATFRDHRQIRQEFLSDDSEENAERYFESADAMDADRAQQIRRCCGGRPRDRRCRIQRQMGFDGSDVSIIELAFPALAVALVFALVRIGNELGSKGTKEIVATANRAKFVGDQRRNTASND
ncbi:hypothetical protein [Rhodococcus sp. AW25M09]|uniref:hypothetical protein n=1 Tax=Rhodococcus sp. AW25M09 TaxID=1268303 RepID=UPI00034731B8|nr:hypothetical protein [Rhodococcus sp. AW25M09]